MLCLPQLVIELQCTVESARVKTHQGWGTIEFFRLNEAMTKTLTTLPFYVIILDLRDQTLDQFHLLKTLSALAKLAVVACLWYSDRALMQLATDIQFKSVGRRMSKRGAVVVSIADKDHRYPCRHWESMVTFADGEEAACCPSYFRVVEAEPAVM